MLNFSHKGHGRSGRRIAHFPAVAARLHLYRKAVKMQSCGGSIPPCPLLLFILSAENYWIREQKNYYFYKEIRIGVQSGCFNI